jgi:hypothetical protein
MLVQEEWRGMQDTRTAALPPAGDGIRPVGARAASVSNAIFTPCGLHVRLPTHIAFGLMAQLQPQVRPSQVLATTEAIEFTPTAVSKLLALLGFVLQLAPVWIGAVTVVGRVAPNLLALAGVPRGSGWTVVGRLYRPVAGHGLSLVIVAAVGALLAGPLAAVSFLAGTLVGGLVNMLVDFLLLRRPDPRFRQPLSSTERFFLDALRRHAERSRQTLDLERLPVTAGENEEAWRAALRDYAAEHPRRARQSCAGDDREPPR